MKRLFYTLALLFPICLQAQQNHHEVGVTLGVANYYGDLQPKFFGSYGYMPMTGIVYKYYTNPHIGIRTGITYTNLTAADSLSNLPNNKLRNLSFATRLLEMHGVVEYNFLAVDVMRRKVSPFIFGGISVFYFNPYAHDVNDNKIYLRPLSTEGQGLRMYPDRKQYSLVNMAFPFGGGVKFLVGKTLFITGEMGFRYTNTDYIDDVSKSYVDLDSLQRYKGKIARNLSYRGYETREWDHQNPEYGHQRGDSKSNDWYWFGNVTVTVYFRAFGNPREYLKTKCPAFFR